MKKFLSVVLSILILISMVPVFEITGFAASESDLTFTINGDGKSYSVTDCSETASDWLVIPATYNGLPVTSIGSRAFGSCRNLTSITIPDSVTSIGSYAFYYCRSLESITIPDSVTSIGSNAFYYCTSLGAITIPDSVTSIGDSAFSSCESLTSIIIPDSVTSIGDSAFSNCESLTSIIIPDSVTSIGDSAFNYCTSLTSITIPNSVTSIGDYAFYYCTSLTSITIPGNVTNIGSSVFSYCEGLVSINVDSSNYAYASVGGVLFNKSLTQIIQYPAGKTTTSYTIPDSVTSIGDSAFRGCTSLTSITIPDSVTSIGRNTFDYCTSLTSITIPDSVTSVGYCAFNYCTSLTSITIPYSVTSIGNFAFEGCTSLTSITIPDSVTSIGDYAFSKCTSLTSITIPDSVTSIGSRTFYNCTNLAMITIPDSVTNIGSYAFYNSGIKRVCYGGSTTQWNNISIGSNNTPLESAELFYNCLTTSTTKAAVIETGGSSESFVFIPSETGKYIFYSTGDSDTKAYLYDEDGNQLVYNDDGGEGYNFQIESTLSAGEPYEYQVSYYGSSKTGTINCELSRLYTITYDANGGSGAPALQTKEDDEEITLSSEKPSKTCGWFQGWSVDPDAKEVHYKVGETYSLQADVTLYAVWVDVHMSITSPNTLLPIWYVETEATCTKEGKKYEVCKNCGEKAYSTIPALGHNYSTDYTIDVESGCTTDGEKSRHCTRCTSTIDTITIPATGHSYGEWQVDRLATYTTPGERHKTCSVCSDLVTDSDVDYAMFVASFISNGGKCDESTRTLISEEPFGALPTPTKSNYIFKGWTLTNCGTDYVTETDYITADTNLYASWELVVPKSVKVSTLPLKTGYCVGDEIETRGLKLLVTYTDGSTKTVSSGFETDYDFSTSGEKKVAVTYAENNVAVATSYDVYVNEPARLYSEKVTVNAGETVDVPVYIENNPGIVGFTIYVEYDDSVFTPVCVNGGDVSGYGMFDDNVGYETENKVQITWSGTENYYDDGELFNITFDVSADSTVRGDYSFVISYEQADTFDENTNDVTLECESTTVTVINEQKEPVEIGGGTFDAIAGQMVDIPVNVINNRDLAGSDLTIAYDSNVLTFVSVAEGLATTVADDSTAGKLVINLETVAQTEQGTLFSVRFKVKDYSSGTEKITITSSDSEIVVKNISVEITNPYADMATIVYSDAITGEIGDTVLVPVYVENNKGMYGFKIRVTYDSNVLKPASYCKGETIITSCGTVSNNISANTKKGRNYFDIMFYGDEIFAENGKMFTLKFTLQQAAPTYTSVKLSYTQDDTYTEINGVETEVVLDCRNIGFKTTGCFVDSDKVYLSELNDSSTIDLLSWLPSAASAVIKNMVTANGSGYGTGTTFDYIADGITTAYTIIVKGDADGDSAIDVLDVMHVERASNNQEAFTDAQTDAGDLNGDGEITAEDYSAMVNLVLH